MSEASRASADEARERLLARVAHDLRSPLNGIKSWAHVLERYLHEAGGDPAAGKAIAGILLGVDEQARILEELVDSARVLGPGFALSRRPMALQSALAGAIDSLAPAAKAKGVELVPPAQEIAAIVDGDLLRLQQLFARLIDHAIGTTPPNGQVRIASRMESSSACVEIRDGGPGVSAEGAASLFDASGLADPPRGRRVRGAGLELAVCRRVAQLHGGDLSCGSDAGGRGVTFKVILPASSA